MGKILFDASKRIPNVIPISMGGTMGTTRETAANNILWMRDNITDTVDNDTQSFWCEAETGICFFTINALHNQPYQYGFLFNLHRYHIIQQLFFCIGVGIYWRTGTDSAPIQNQSWIKIA